MPAESTAVSVVSNAQRIVAKVGSSLVTNEGRGLDRAAVAHWAAQIAALRKQAGRWCWCPAARSRKAWRGWAGASVRR